MQIVDLPIEEIQPASWSANEMTTEMKEHLRSSIERFDLVVPLVVRHTKDGLYETVGGAQRLAVMKVMGATTVPCVFVHIEDTEARLLSQALNRIAGEDDLGRRADIIRDLLEAMPEQDILAILPDSAENLRALASIGETTIADQLWSRQRAQSARLHHLRFELTQDQMAIVEEAMERAQAGPGGRQGVNRKVQALMEICESYISKLRGER